MTAVSREGNYVRVWLDAPAAWRKIHKHPGQYITARFGASRHRFLVLANAPHESASSGYELLIEPNEDLTPVLDKLRPGQVVLASGPEGDGFPVAFGGAAVGMVATGSGIAGLRPVLAHWARHAEHRPRSARLFYEEEAGVAHAYRDELERWAEEDWLEVEFVSHLAEEPFIAERIDYEQFPDNADLLLCGAPAMIAAVSSRALTRGLDTASIHTNI